MSLAAMAETDYRSRRTWLPASPWSVPELKRSRGFMLDGSADVHARRLRRATARQALSVEYRCDRVSSGNRFQVTDLESARDRTRRQPGSSRAQTKTDGSRIIAATSASGMTCCTA